MKNKEYSNFVQYNNKFVANSSVKGEVASLPPGIYTIHFDPRQGILWFQETTVLSDQILNLPSAEYEQVVKEINLFLEPTTKESFKKYGYIYKRSTLMHGLPGTGKTVITQRLVRDVIDKKGIVLYVDNPKLLGLAYDALKDICPDVLTMVVFEEFDRMAARFETDLLSILDGEIQKDNVVYLATTNYIDKIPARLRRPGRFSTVIEVHYPTLEARLFYLENKLFGDSRAKSLAERTEGLSIDELKEVIQAHVILKQPLDYVLGRIWANKQQNPPEDKNLKNQDMFLMELEDQPDEFEEEDNSNG